MLLAPLVFLFAFSGSPQSQSNFFVVPNFRDLKVRVSRQQGLGPELMNTWYFKGSRERLESGPKSLLPPFAVTLFECDQKTQVHMNARAKTYFSLPLGLQFDSSPERTVVHVRPSQETTTVTMDSEDTGERRQQGSYEARHVKTTITVTPAKASTLSARKTEIDGWYIDIPGMSCRNAELDIESKELAIHTMGPTTPGQFPRFTVKHTGNGRRGFAIEEISRETGQGNVLINKIKLVEFSEEQLDQSLFEIPADFTESQRPRSAFNDRPTP